MNRLEIAVRVYLDDRERNIPRAFDVADEILKEEGRRAYAAAQEANRRHQREMQAQIAEEQRRQTEIRRARALLHGGGSG